MNGVDTQGIIITRRVSEGFSLTQRQSQKHNPSLTQRVGIVANAELQKPQASVHEIAHRMATLSFAGQTAFRQRSAS